MAAKRQHEPGWRKKREEVLARDGGMCRIKDVMCVGEASEVDHLVAKKDGGTDSLSNLRSTCKPCHNARGRTDRIYPSRDWFGDIAS